MQQQQQQQQQHHTCPRAAVHSPAAAASRPKRRTTAAEIEENLIHKSGDKIRGDVPEAMCVRVREGLVPDDGVTCDV